MKPAALFLQASTLFSALATFARDLLPFGAELTQVWARRYGSRMT